MPRANGHGSRDANTVRLRPGEAVDAGIIWMKVDLGKSPTGTPRRLALSNTALSLPCLTLLAYPKSLPMRGTRGPPDYSRILLRA